MFIAYYQTTSQHAGKIEAVETVLLKLTNDLLWSMERKNVTVIIVLDLSPAFNTVNHEVLLTTLKSSFGIKRMALK